MIGQRFGRLVVMSDAPRQPDRQRRVECRCDCGSTKVIRWASLCRGSTRSCGCLRVEERSTHGRSGELVAGRRRMTKEYLTWVSIKQRCLNPKRPNFRYYGGRGIMVCLEWAESFEAFLRDMGTCPSDDLSIDRIDADGHYEPGNCRWATREQQARNKRSSAHGSRAGG